MRTLKLVQATLQRMVSRFFLHSNNFIFFCSSKMYSSVPDQYTPGVLGYE
uniref:Uncharacterized protein n=1 Tax=Arundo donax TaxID=35708 RepID=A0A0A9FPJ8_ARUDO